MTVIDETLKNLIQEAREKTALSATDLLATAVRLFEEGIIPVSCFLAMTTIEEVGKLIVLRMAQGVRLQGYPGDVEPPQVLDEAALRNFTRNHLQKAVQAAAWSLFINSEADRRHGVHPSSQIHRTNGVILLARSRRWMTLRNACLYTDLDIASAKATSPTDVVTREHAYYFIAMAFEILAEQAEAGIGIPFVETPSSQAHQFFSDRLEELEVFMTGWRETVDVDKLDFLAHPEVLQREAEEIEARNKK